MRCSRLLVLGLGLTLAWLCYPRPAAAAVQFEYRAPPTCPDREVAWQALSAYSPVELAPAGGDYSAAVQLEISSTEAVYAGRVRVALMGHVVERQVSDTRCEALVEALVLIAAIVLDQERRAFIATPQTKGNGTLRISRKSLSVETPASWSVGLAVGMRISVAPTALLTPGVYVAHRRAHFGMVGLYHASLTFGQTESLRFDLGEAKFTWGAGRFAACPVGDLRARISYAVCGMAEVGWLRGQGLSITAANSTGGVWLAPGLGLTANIDVGPLQFGALGGAIVPLVRDRYYFSPNETVHRSNWLGWVAEMQLGWRFAE